MKKITAVLTLGIVAYACAPKVAVTAMQPDLVQVPPKMASVEEEKPVAADLEVGKSLYENRCNKCHDLYEPKDFTAEEWKPIMAKMQIKAKIDNAQTASIYNYIVSGL